MLYENTLFHVKKMNILVLVKKSSIYVIYCWNSCARFNAMCPSTLGSSTSIKICMKILYICMLSHVHCSKHYKEFFLDTWIRLWYIYLLIQDIIPNNKQLCWPENYLCHWNLVLNIATLVRKNKLKSKTGLMRFLTVTMEKFLIMFEAVYSLFGVVKSVSIAPTIQVLVLDFRK